MVRFRSLRRGKWPPRRSKGDCPRSRFPCSHSADLSRRLPAPHVLPSQHDEAFETEGTKSLAANRTDVCAGHRCHTLNSGFGLRTDPWQQYLTANSDRLSHFGHRMSLFLQTLVLRGILFREQEHRQERIGVAMTLWPTGRNDEKKRMKSRLATSMRSAFLRMNSGDRILVSMLVAVIVTSLSLKARAQDESAHTGGPASLILAAESASSAPRAQSDLVEFEKMTWVEMKSALAAGKTTALIYTGGVEERGPQNANGGHNLIAHATVEAIARKLGNAIFLPVLPYTPNDAESIPGTIGITNELLAAMLERIAEQAALNGFRNVILMGDHGGGQPQVYEEVAKKLDGTLSGGARVFYCDQVYRPANDAFDQYLTQHGYPLGLHGYLFDTSEMMYLDKDNTWVRRDLVSSAVGDPVVGHTAGDGKAQFGPHSPQNGILGDARRSTAELGKRAFDMKVDFAVRQIRSLLSTS